MSTCSKLLLGSVVSGGLLLAAFSPAFANGRYGGSLKDGPPIARYGWTGLYIGAHAGYAWSETDWNVVSENSAFWDNSGGAGTTFAQDSDGFMGGGQIGYNFQSGPWVFGLEVSFSATDLEASRFAETVSGDDLRTTKVGSLALVTGRVGYAFDQWLPYVKGGFATANVRTSVSDDVPGNVGTWSASERHNGWTVGAGLEYMLNSNLTFGVEYNYIDLGSKSHDAATSELANAAVDVDTTLHAITARLNFKLTP